ncbi:phage tail protein [Metasolibacillus meyeri]|uniref:phage tail-collar fiber domain-containing protein n=1 Tax=Metasolibacillus meyeri TaxID=1071052 RepID=UPI000D2F8CD8|nr:phage tail protein [Metasolibacillus meyeri]
MTQYGTIITEVGLAKIANAQVTQQKIGLEYIALGDGNGAHYVPKQNQSTLINEVWRGPVASVTIDSANDNRIIIDGVIPAEAGGFTIREVGIFDDQNQLIAVGQYPEKYKPQLSEGVSEETVIHFVIETNNADVVKLAIDPTIIIASRSYVDGKIAAHTNPAKTDAHQIGNIEGLAEALSGIGDAQQGIESHISDTSKHLQVGERDKINNAQLYKLTRDNGHVKRLADLDITPKRYAELPPGYYYLTTAENNAMEDASKWSAGKFVNVFQADSSGLNGTKIIETTTNSTAHTRKEHKSVNGNNESQWFSAENYAYGWGILINDAINMNDMLTEGLYYTDAWAKTQLIMNRPTPPSLTTGCQIRVYKTHTHGIVQEFTFTSGGTSINRNLSRWVRSFNATWSPWTVIPMLEPSTLLTTEKNDLGKIINELFQSVSNGKSLVANAITQKGVPTAANAEFATMANNIGQIQTFRRAENLFAQPVSQGPRHEIELLFNAGFPIKDAVITLSRIAFGGTHFIGKMIRVRAGLAEFWATQGYSHSGIVRCDVSNYIHSTGAQTVIDGQYVRIRLTVYSDTFIDTQTLPINVVAWG